MPTTEELVVSPYFFQLTLQLIKFQSSNVNIILKKFLGDNDSSPFMPFAIV